MSDLQFRSTRAGTYAYMSPESLMGNLQGTESDLWSLGILLYELHMGKEPFAGKSSSDMLHLISNQPIKFSSKNFSREAMNIVKSLLKFKANKRMKLQQILKSKFIRKFRNSSKLETSDKMTSLNSVTNQNIVQFNPPPEVFTSKFGQKESTEQKRKSRPLFNNMNKFKCLIESNTSLYQPLNWERPNKSTRRISRIKKPPVEKVIRPKIYLNNTQSINSKGNVRKKTFSNQSMGFLSKEENGPSSKDIKVSSFFKQNKKRMDTTKKHTMTTKHEMRKNSFQIKQTSSSFLNLNNNNNNTICRNNRSLSEVKLKTSNHGFLSSLNILKNRSIDRFSNSPSRSIENHFIRSNNQDSNLISNNNSNPINIHNSPVRIPNYIK